MNEITRIKELLSEAANLDNQARALRQEAGRLLAQRYYADPQSNCWYLDCGLDKQSALYLMEIGLAHRFYPAA